MKYGLEDAYFDIYDIPGDISYMELADNFGNTDPLKRILKIVEEEGCRSVLIEHNVIDEEYYQEFQAFYSKTSIDQKFAERLHFFAITADEIMEADLEELQQEQREKDGVIYLGYCTIRPIPAKPVSESVIQPPKQRGEPPINFILCKTEFYANIKGDKLRIIGTPFLQQDYQTGKCAQAALWIGNRYMQQRHGYAYYSLPEITQLGSKSPRHTRDLPTAGLSTTDMRNILELMGYTPVLYEPELETRKEWDSLSIIYRYMESELPVFLELREPHFRHVVTVIGHTFNPNVETEKMEVNSLDHVGIKGTVKKIRYYHSANWVDKYIVHDDARGPYMQDDVDGLKGKIHGILVPLPPEVLILGEDAEIMALHYIEDNIDRLNRRRKKNPDTHSFINDWRDGNIVVRTYLTTSAEYKSRIKRVEMMNDIVKSYYQFAYMPEYIWITEISTIREKRFSRDRMMAGEVIIDSTGTMLPQALNFVAIHVPGFLAIRNLITGKIQMRDLEGDKMYSHRIRRQKEAERIPHRRLTLDRYI